MIPKPLHDFVAIEALESEFAKSIPLILPDSMLGWVRLGVVRGVGPKTKAVVEGDRVLYTGPAAQRNEDFDFDFMRESDIYAILREDRVGAPPERILVKATEKQTVFNSIILPDQLQERPCIAEVASVGPSEDDCGAKAGDSVYLPKHACTHPVKLQGEEYFFVRHTDILAIIH